MEKKTLIVNYAGLSVGGIEKFTGNLMRYALSQGHRVIWFTFKEAFEGAIQKKTANNPKIEKVFFAAGRRKFLAKNPDINLSSDEDVVMISFTQEDYIWAEQFRHKYKCKSFYHHFILMNFFGWLTYPEDEFNNKFLSKKRASFSNKIAHQLDKNQCIHAFNTKQLVAYKDRYDLNYTVSKDLCLKAFPYEPINFEEKLLKKSKTRNEEFIITTCARFQFPHKGYMIGLLDEFAKLVEKYDNVKLIIVGDGERDVINKKLDTLTDKVKSKIELKGILPLLELLDLYIDSHMAIGLAGSISNAASCGIPSLVVRHDTLNCETYGFFKDVDSTLKSEPGESILPYIEKVINMSDEEYIRLGQAENESLEKRLIVDPDYILKEKNISSIPSVSKMDLNKNKIWAMISLLKKYIKNI